MYAQKRNKYTAVHIYGYVSADTRRKLHLCSIWNYRINNLLLFQCLRLRKRYNNDFMLSVYERNNKKYLTYYLYTVFNFIMTATEYDFTKCLTSYEINKLFTQFIYLYFCASHLLQIFHIDVSQLINIILFLLKRKLLIWII